MAEAMIREDHRDSFPDFQEQQPRSNTTKTVVIHAPPKKRRKISSAANLKDIEARLSSSVAPEDRAEAIAMAMNSFNHNVQVIHDEEIASHVDSVLTKHLGYLLLRRDYQTSPETRQALSKEIADTCATLEMVYRASVTTVLEQFKLVGGELMTLLLKAIDDELCNRLSLAEGPDEGTAVDGEDPFVGSNNTGMKDYGPQDDGGSLGTGDDGTQASEAVIALDRTEEGDTILCKASKTLGHFARVGEATQPMAFHPGLLSTLINQMNAQPNDAVPVEARLNAIWIIANLACNEENMVMMACHPELLASLIAIASRSATKSTPAATLVEVLRAQSIAVRALLNLSWANENRIPMAEMNGLVQVLSKLILFRQPPKRGRTIQELVLQTRQQAAGTLRNLAGAPRRNKIRLCEYENGLLLDVLTDAILNDVDDGVKKRAFATINNLAFHDTAMAMVKHPALVLALKNALLDDNAIDLKPFAKGTLMVLERSITSDMDCYFNLRELLDAVNPATTETAGEE